MSDATTATAAATPRVVWMLNHYAQAPTGAGGHTRHYSLAKYLPAHGWRGIVIAASTELNTGIQRLRAEETYADETHGDVLFRWVKTPSYRGNGLGRLWNMLNYGLRAILPRTTRGLPRPDAVIGSSAHPFAAMAGYVLARRYRAPFIYEVRDLWPQSLIDLGQASPRHPAILLFAAMEKFLSRRAARIMAIPPLLARYFTPRGIAAEKIIVIPNGIDLGFFPPPAPKASAMPFTFMYFGAHGHGNALHHLLEAMAMLNRAPGLREQVCLRLIGNGPLKPELEKQAAALGLTNVSFEAPVPKGDIPALAAQADAFAFNVMDAPVLTHYGISPNKLFDFLAGARPVLFACSAANNPVAEAGAGITVEAGNPAAMAQAMQQLIALPPEERAAMGARGRAYVEAHHSFAALAAHCAAMLDATLAEAR